MINFNLNALIGAMQIGALIGIVSAVVVLLIAGVVYFAFFNKKVMQKAKQKQAEKQAKKQQQLATQQNQNDFAQNAFANKNEHIVTKNTNSDEDVLKIIQKQEDKVIDTSKFKKDSRFAKEDQLEDDTVKNVLSISKHENKKVEAKKQEEPVLAPNSDADKVASILNRSALTERKDVKVNKQDNGPISNEEEVLKTLKFNKD